MSYLIINGGRKLHGQVVTQANKNSALSILCACLLMRGRTTITDVPDIADVEKIFALIASAGAKIERPSPHTVLVDTSHGLKISKLDRAAAESTRASLLLFGALANQGGHYKLYKSGGCHLGTRTVRPHQYALHKLGVEIKSQAGYYEVYSRPALSSRAIVMYESGDTTTENVMLAAVLARGTTVIKMASANYMVQDLGYFLKAAGAKIYGLGTTTLTITGVKKLRPVRRYSIMPDPIGSMTLLAAGIVTKSRLTVTNCPLEFLELELEKLSVMGQKFQIKNKRRSKNKKFLLGDIALTPSVLTALPDKIYGRPFPGLNIDNLPLFVPILTQAKGRTLVHDWVYEDRLLYSLELKKLGAAITLIDTHRVWVEGPTRLVAGELICPPALRPAVNILICMLAARGRSILRNVAEIDRGYEDLSGALRSVGADITKINE